jgi:hypothetical protein
MTVSFFAKSFANKSHKILFYFETKLNSHVKRCPHELSKI